MKKVGHAVVSATQTSSVTIWLWQHAAKENSCQLASWDSVVDTKTRINQMGSNILNVGKKMILIEYKGSVLWKQ